MPELNDILYIIIGVLAALLVVSVIWGARRGRNSAPAPLPIPASASAPSAAAEDEAEVVAAIIAAISAMSGTPPEGLVIRSFTRVDRQNWKAAARGRG